MLLKPLVQAQICFSEVHRQDVIDGLVEVVARSGGVFVLDVAANKERQQTEVMLVGLPTEIEKAAYAGVRLAADQIDVTLSEVPHIGAVDTLALMPVRDVPLDQCVAMAHRLGSHFAQNLRIPVYFYEAAAMRPEHRTLAVVRQPEFLYPRLLERISTDPHLMPDVGPAQLSTAGSIFVGAHLPPIDCHLYLSTIDAPILLRIAEAAHYETGGLRHVTATVLEEGILHLRLMDFRQTPLPRVIELIRREAARYGVVVERCEMLGLIPQAVFTDSATWYLSITNFDTRNLLENRIADAELKQIPLAGEEPPIPADATMHIALPDAQAHGLGVFASAVAEPSVTPGGGAVSALVGGLAAALAEMCSGLTLGKRGYEDTADRMRAIGSTAASLRGRLLMTVDDEIEAFQQLMNALRLSPENSDREDTIQAAMLHATDIPVEVARLSFEALQLLEQVVAQGNHNTVIDGAVGTHMALAAIESAGLNVRSNLLGLTNPDIVRRYNEEVERLIAAGHELKQRIVATAEQRAGLTEE